MREVTLAESGLKYIYMVFREYGGITCFLAFYLLAVLYLVFRGDKREKCCFVGSFIVLLCTVYNPFLMNFVIKKMGMESVYYRFIWILPVLLLIAYVATKFVSELQKRRSRMVCFSGFIIIIMLSGNFIFADGLPELPQNQYKVEDGLLDVTTMLHEEAPMEYPKVVFEFDYNIFARQYDATLLLTLDRDVVLLNAGSKVVGVRGLGKYEVKMEQIILNVIYNYDEEVDKAEFMDALYQTETDYLVVSVDSPIRAYITEAGCLFCRENTKDAIYKVVR